MSETHLGQKVLKHLEERGSDYCWTIAKELDEPYLAVQDTLEKLFEEKRVDKTPERNCCPCSGRLIEGNLYSLGTGKTNELKYFNVNPDAETREEFKPILTANFISMPKTEKGNKSELEYFT